MKPLVEPYPATNVVWVDETDSTNALAERLAARWDEDEPFFDTVVVGGRQLAGRGRDGRRWESPEGGVYLTWAGVVPAEGLKRLPMVAGVAAAGAVGAVSGTVRIGLKWPNDLVVAGRKLGGILSRARVRGSVAWAAVGCGINVEVTPPVIEGASLPATSLRQEGWSGTAADARWRLVAWMSVAVRRLLDDGAGCAEQWRALLVHRRGDRMRLRLAGEAVDCHFVGIGPDGELEVEVAGEKRSFAAVDVVDLGE